MYINENVLNITNGSISIIDSLFGDMNIEKVEAGKLKLKTGKIIATDPIFMYDDQCFSKHVSPNTYTVYVYNGKTEKRKVQTLLAEIKINENTPIRWEMALLEGENSSKFARDEFMGYEVENGLGCFMDECVMDKLDIMGEEELTNYENNIRKKVKNSVNACADILIDEKTGSNIIVFPTGWNDGTFPTYYGYDKNNKVAKIVTDFMVIEK